MAGFGNLGSLLNGDQAPSEADRLKLSSGVTSTQAGTPTAQTGPSGVPQPGQPGGGTGFINFDQRVQANKTDAQGMARAALDKANAAAGTANQFSSGLSGGMLNGVPLTQEMIDNGLAGANAGQRYAQGLSGFGGLANAIGTNNPMDAALAGHFMGSQAADLASKYGGLASMIGGLSPYQAPPPPGPVKGTPTPQGLQPGFQPVNQPMGGPSGYTPRTYRDPYMKPNAGPRGNWRDVYGDEK